MFQNLPTMLKLLGQNLVSLHLLIENINKSVSTICFSYKIPSLSWFLLAVTVLPQFLIIARNCGKMLLMRLRLQSGWVKKNLKVGGCGCNCGCGRQFKTMNIFRRLLICLMLCDSSNLVYDKRQKSSLLTVLWLII